MPLLKRWLSALPVACAVALAAAPAHAQLLPSRPIEFADGRATVGADISASIANDDDDPGFFNYTDYEYSAMRLFRVALIGSFTANPRLAFLSEVEFNNLDD